MQSFSLWKELKEIEYGMPDSKTYSCWLVSRVHCFSRELLWVPSRDVIVRWIFLLITKADIGWTFSWHHLSNWCTVQSHVGSNSRFCLEAVRYRYLSHCFFFFSAPSHTAFKTENWYQSAGAHIDQVDGQIVLELRHCSPSCFSWGSVLGTWHIPVQIHSSKYIYNVYHALCP